MRIAAGLLVKALIRRVHDAGGSAMMLAKGDATAGAILVVTLDRGVDPHVYERGIGPDGATTLIETGPKDSDASAISDYWRRRSARDPDLWVVELDVADAKRFAAETIASD